MAKKNASRNSYHYNRIPLVENDDFNDMQYQKPTPKVPYKAIILALVLTVGGSILITIGALLISGHIDAMYGDRTWPLILLGSIMFIPGAYHMRIAFYAYCKTPGYTFDEIPEFD